MKLLVDRHGRTKRKLRLSLTDRCNFRCRYCMPDEPTWLPRKELLSNAELLRLAALFVEQGITQFRLTGGEPLLRMDLEDVVAQLNGLRAKGLERISMTSNGTLLAKRAQALVDAGVDDFNISLDALDESVFTRLTKADIHPVLAGIDAARATGVSVKINTVLVRGYNDDQVLPLLEWAMAKNLPLRFIEYMPLDEPGRWQRQSVMDEDAVLAILRSRHRVEKLARSSDPASPYLVDGHYPLGIISTVSHPFCASCDRLRLTAKGELYTCLFAANGTPLGEPLRQGASDEQLQEKIAQAVWHKQAGYAAVPEPVERPIRMYAMGG
ncbi:MAG TPA: GTP 3',8-cyclase MoaA [Pseudomonadales bacterium]|jgi:cyclic pyranopterin phosphate synthase|nr:GTP 3',8-cyclase MoaA [Cellvibrionales bacterium]HRF87429.1 GTP 3',8-cyclase MoaA [Pseudomonadales bacterium]HRG49779.1 GTP 3',8-cyclase MoaA [Pseudomonadales bacterium]